MKTELSRLSRLTSLLIILQSKRIVTATELANKFSVSVRTIYRDIKALERAGVPIYTEEGKGYSLLEGYNLPPIMFTEEEANALITAEKLVARNKDKSLVEQHQNAVTKVKAVLRYASKDKANLLSERLDVIKNLQQETTSDNLITLQKCITHSKLTKVQYFSATKQELSDRTLEPMALYHSQDNWILIAWCRLRNAFREFRLDRIKKLNVMDDSFDKRPFELIPYFMSLKYGDQNNP